MNRLGDYAIGYQGSDDPFENYIDEYPIATKREIWEQAHREGWDQAKREADSLLLDLIDVVLESKPVVQSARRAIANMPYKEPRDD